MKKIGIALVFVFLIIASIIPTYAANNNMFIISKPEFCGVMEGNEYESDILPNGTVRAKVDLDNRTDSDQTVILYIASKDDENRMINVNMKTVVVPSGVRLAGEYVDIEVSNNTKETVYFYICDENQSPYCTLETWEKAPAADIIEVKACVSETRRTDASLYKKSGAEYVEIDLYKVYNDEDKDKYRDMLYTFGSYNGGLDWVLKNNLKVLAGDTDIENYLGYVVDIDLGLTDDYNLEVLSYEVDTDSMEELTVTKDIVYAYASSYGAFFEYWEDIDNDAQVTEVDIATNAAVYLNGMMVGYVNDNASGKQVFESLDDATFGGIVKFVGAKGETFSKVFITDYIYAQVEKVYVEDEYIVTDCLSLELGEEQRGTSFFYNIYKDGEEISISDIKQNDVLSIIAPNCDIDSGNYVDIYVCDEKLTGQVTASSSSNNRKYYINGVEYTTITANLLSIGEKGTYFLTHDGMIYSIDYESTLSDNYGFILKVGNTSSFGENTYQVRLFTKEGKTKTYTVAPTLKVSEWTNVAPTAAPSATPAPPQYKYVETSYKRANNGQDAIMARLYLTTDVASSEPAAYASLEQRLITYELEDDMITKITLASDSVARADLNKVYDVNSFMSGTYRPTIEKFANYIYTDKTKFFYAPIIETYNYNYGAYGYEVDIDNVALVSTSMLDEEEMYEGYIYATNADKEFGAAVITSPMGFGGKKSALAVVIGKAEGLDANGKIAETITVLKGGEVATYVVNDDADFTSFASLASGDIIQFVLNGVDEITAAELVFDAGNGLGVLNTTYTTATAGAEIQFVYGIVSDVASNYITLSTNHYSTGTYKDFAVNYEEGSTLAKIDMAKIAVAPQSAITKVSSVSSFSPTIDTYSSQYVMVARVVDEEIVDAVAYKLDVASIDANRDGAELNAQEYKVALY